MIRSSTTAILLAALLAGSCTIPNHRDAGTARSPVVATATGSVRGAVHDGVASFKGIPFAAPPVGELRWRAPRPVTPWSDVRDATQFGPHCPQIPFQNTLGDASIDEDCLYLNVWTPARRDDELLPVMVWIHGGGFVIGGTARPELDGSNLARESVVVVSTNYRLGRFGFFAHPALTGAAADDGLLGNYGIMDQIAALRWVQDNVAAFGGDPGNVTIFGESAGGASVHYLMASPLAKGLFARAISQSGLGRSDLSQLLPFCSLADAERFGAEFARSHDIQGDGAEALDALRSLPASAISNGLSIPAIFAPANTFGGPIADGTVVPEHFEHRYAAGEAAAVPLIVGATDADGFFMFQQHVSGQTTPPTLDQIYARFGALSDKARQVYDPTGADEADIVRIGTLVDADLLFIEPARHIAELHSAAGVPVYHYRFSYVADAMRGTMIGAPHFSDVPFVFGTLDAPLEAPTANDRRAAAEIQAYWLAFAKTGVPAPHGLPAWPTHADRPNRILDFTSDGPEFVPDPARERLDLAKELSESRRGK